MKKNYKKKELAENVIKDSIIVKQKITKILPKNKFTFSDLGFSFENEYQKEFAQKNFTTKYGNILPEEIIKDINYCELKIRSILSKYTMQTSWGKLIKKSSLPFWLEENNPAVEKYLNIKKRIFLKYDNVVGDIRSNFKEELINNWKLAKDTEEKPSDPIIDNYLNKIMSEIPRRESIFSTLKYDHFFLDISGEQNDGNERYELLIDETINQFRRDLIFLSKKARKIINNKKKITSNLLSCTKKIFIKNEYLNFYDNYADSIVDEIKNAVKNKRSEINLEELSLIFLKLENINKK